MKRSSDGVKWNQVVKALTFVESRSEDIIFETDRYSPLPTLTIMSLRRKGRLRRGTLPSESASENVSGTDVSYMLSGKTSNTVVKPGVGFGVES